jgi:hypothetical protein
MVDKPFRLLTNEEFDRLTTAEKAEYLQEAVEAQKRVLAQFEKRSGQRVVVKAAPAIHAGGPGGDIGDAHACKSRGSRVWRLGLEVSDRISPR